MTANRRRGGPRRLFWVLGVALLLATAIGAGVVLNPSHAGKSTTPEKQSSSEQFAVVCLGHVDVEAGVTPLNPTLPGKVAEVQAEEEKSYHAGAVLLTLDKEAAALRLQEAEKDLELAKEKLRQAEKNSKRDHDEAIELQELAVETARYKANAADKELSEESKQVQRKLVSKLLFEKAKALVESLKTQHKLEQKKLEQLKKRDITDQTRRARLVVAARETQVERARKALKDCDVVAPVDGKVLRVQVNKGEAIGTQPAQAAILFLPAAKERIIRAEVPQEFAWQVAENSKVRIEDDTRPEDSVHWDGKVIRMSDWYTHRRSILQEPLQFNDVRTLECIVAVTHDPSKPRLRIGQRVRVKIASKTPTK
jgi:multidrug resistance efflux pump